MPAKPKMKKPERMLRKCQKPEEVTFGTVKATLMQLQNLVTCADKRLFSKPSASVKNCGPPPWRLAAG